MPILLLHLSDIHIDLPSDPILQQAASIARCTFPFLVNAEEVVVAVSGDIADKGTAAQYSLAEELLIGISLEIESEFPTIRTRFAVCPGNHDCDFDGNNSLRRGAVKLVQESPKPDIDDSVIAACTSIQTAFLAFQARMMHPLGGSSTPLRTELVVPAGGGTIGIECLNISWVSAIKETPGTLYFPVTQLPEGPSGDGLLVTMMHHPLNWFSQNIYHEFRSRVRARAHLVITGHEHTANSGTIDDDESGQSAFVESAALQSRKDGLKNSCFNIVLIDVAARQFSTIPFSWNGAAYVQTEAPAPKNLAKKQNKIFEPTDQFSSVMHDPGAFLRAGNRDDLRLSDLFVFPDLQKIGDDLSSRRSLVDSSCLLNPDTLVAGVILHGDEKSGQTSLLLRLFEIYLERGFVPVLIRGRDLRRATSSGVDEVIWAAVCSQYGKEALETYKQTQRTRKLVIVDDLDESPVRASSLQCKLVSELRLRSSMLIASVGPAFEVQELASQPDGSAITSFVQYRMQPFGAVKRAKLIEKWFRLSRGAETDDAQFIVKCDEAERLFGGVVHRSIIPHVPLHLLTLLQSVEIGRPGELKESGLGHYYQFLLTEALQQSGVRPELLDELFQYTSCLAWEFNERTNQTITKQQLQNFNKRFSEEWHTVELEGRLALLISARVLMASGGEYQFRYPYIYYHLKGLYISSRLDSEEIRRYISRCCAHLYVRDNANTILFLAHFTTNEWLLGELAKAVGAVFTKVEAVRFDGDLRKVDELISTAPKLKYLGGRPEEHRERRNRLVDERGDDRDGLHDEEENQPELSVSAQVATIFKTGEILGQVLKDQYAKIPRVKRKQLLSQIFSGSLRALSDFYGAMGSNPERLIDEIGQTLKGKEGLDPKERDRLARRAVADIVLMVTATFLMRAARSANSEKLYEDVDSVVSQQGGLAYRLIKLALRLDGGGAIPRSELELVYKQSETSLVATRFIQLLVLNRLYMFKTTEPDMQWINSKLGIAMDFQHKLSYQVRGERIH